MGQARAGYRVQAAVTIRVNPLPRKRGRVRVGALWCYCANLKPPLMIVRFRENVVRRHVQPAKQFAALLRGQKTV